MNNKIKKALFTKDRAINSTIKHDLGKVVALGGGHGLGRLLSALSFLDQNLTGIVTTTDDGGSTGRLRNETGCIAWGDLRIAYINSPRMKT